MARNTNADDETETGETTIVGDEKYPRGDHPVLTAAEVREQYGEAYPVFTENEYYPDPAGCPKSVDFSTTDETFFEDVGLVQCLRWLCQDASQAEWTGENGEVLGVAPVEQYEAAAEALDDGGVVEGRALWTLYKLLVHVDRLAPMDRAQAGLDLIEAARAE